MATEVLIPMGSVKAYASNDLTAGRLIAWDNVPEHVRYTAWGERPVGIIVSDVATDEILNHSLGGAAEFFKTAGIVKTALTWNHTAGTRVMSGNNGTIVEYDGVATNHAFGVVLTSGSDGDEAEIYIY